MSYRLRTRRAYPITFAADSTKDFDITLATVFARIDKVTAPTSASPGESILISVQVTNTGTGKGKLWCQIVERDTGTIVGEKQTTAIDIGPGETNTFNFQSGVNLPVMPNKNWLLRAEAGH
jgi:hypothetical protein